MKPRPVFHGAFATALWSEFGRAGLLAPLPGTDGADTLTSGSAGDLLSGLGGDDVLLGRGGDDTLDGGTGTDTMTGGTGNDVYLVDMSGDVLVERAGGGLDTAVVLVHFYVLAANIENLDGSTPGFSGRSLIGNDLDNVITGSAGNDNLVGAAGSDTLKGGLGNDYYRIEDGGDVITEGRNAGRDAVLTDLAFYRLPANVEALYAMGSQGQKAIGNALDNELIGGQASDTLSGGQGDDTLMGQLGRDVLSGGDGADWFAFFGAYSSANVARITDFSGTDGDLIGLRQIPNGEFNQFALGQLAASAFKSYASLDELDATDRILYEAATGKLYYDQDGAGIVPATQFALLADHPVLTAADFWVYL